jgi:PKD repeat protein
VGSFTVSLKVTDDAGRSGTTTQTVTVSQFVDPTASFIASPSTAELNKPVSVNASASKASSGHSIVRYDWDFGDGTGAFGGGVTEQHSYSSVGSFTISLKVTDDSGRFGVVTQTVTVGTVVDPTASFVFSPTTPRLADVINVNASASKAAGAHTIVNYQWDFGDGTPLVSGGPTAQHKYAAIGSYAIVLKVTDDAGRFSVVSQTIAILP